MFRLRYSWWRRSVFLRRSRQLREWQAGVAKVNISPELPIWLSGYATRNGPPATKHDDLWAKALVIEDAAPGRARDARPGWHSA